MGNHAPLIQTVDAIRWNSYISVKAGAGARPFVAAPTPEHCFFTVRVYQMYTVYIHIPCCFQMDAERGVDDIYQDTLTALQNL